MKDLLDVRLRALRVDPPCISQKFCYHLTTEILRTYYLALYVLQPAGTKLTRIRAFIYGSFRKCVEDRC